MRTVGLNVTLHRSIHFAIGFSIHAHAGSRSPNDAKTFIASLANLQTHVVDDHVDPAPDHGCGVGDWDDRIYVLFSDHGLG